jgi:cobalt/nickel transport system ATP-binding protein
MKNIIEVNNVSFEYITDENTLKAIDNLNLEVKEGEFVAIIGHNGSGKSTLSKNLNAILFPTEGNILINEMDTREEDNLWDIRQTAGMVFQNPDNQIVATIVEEDVAFGPLNLGLSMEEVQDRVEEALDRVGMSGFEKTAPHHLSGGQKKRVAIAGILAMKPEIMVLDEPTAGLDPQGVVDLSKLLNELNDEGITIIISTHEVDLVPNYASKVFVLVDGLLIGEGTPKEIFAKPEILEQANLKVPIVTELFQDLEDEGFDMHGDYPLTIQEAKDKFLELLNRN